MTHYDMPQVLSVQSSTKNNNPNNPNCINPHLYYQQQQQQQLHQHQRLKNESFSFVTNNARPSLNDTSSGLPDRPMSKTPIPQQQRSINYVNSSRCPEPSLKHARLDPSTWPNTT